MPILTQYKEILNQEINDYQKNNSISTTRKEEVKQLLAIIEKAKLASSLRQQLVAQEKLIKGNPMTVIFGSGVETSKLKLGLRKILAMPDYQPLTLLQAELAEQFAQNEQLCAQLKNQEKDLPKVWEQRFKLQDKRFEQRFSAMANKINTLLEENLALTTRCKNAEETNKNLEKAKQQLETKVMAQAQIIANKDDALEAMRQVNLDQSKAIEVAINERDDMDDELQRMLEENERLRTLLVQHNIAYDGSRTEKTKAKRDCQTEKQQSLAIQSPIKHSKVEEVSVKTVASLMQFSPGKSTHNATQSSCHLAYKAAKNDSVNVHVVNVNVPN